MTTDNIHPCFSLDLSEEILEEMMSGRREIIDDILDDEWNIEGDLLLIDIREKIHSFFETTDIRIRRRLYSQCVPMLRYWFFTTYKSKINA